jgi:hypothetical protein
MRDSVKIAYMMGTFNNEVRRKTTLRMIKLSISQKTVWADPQLVFFIIIIIIIININPEDGTNSKS